jgi:hypothetical protein
MGALVDIGREMIVSNKQRIGPSKISPPIFNLQAGAALPIRSKVQVLRKFLLI